MLEQEMETLTSSEMNMVKVGGGVVTSGSGTQSDPYVITAKFYYGSQMSGFAVTGLIGAVNNYNSLGKFEDNQGKWYKFDFCVTYSSDPKTDALSSQNITDSDHCYGNYIQTASPGDCGPDAFGCAGANDVNIDYSKVNAVYESGYLAATTSGGMEGSSGLGASGQDFHPQDYGISRSDFYTDIFEHEFGHILGGADLAGGPMQEFDLTVTHHQSGDDTYEFTTPSNPDENFAQSLVNQIGSGPSGGYIYNPL